MQTILLPYQPDPHIFFEKLRHLPNFIWLDSGRPMSTQGRYDIFTACPTSYACINAQGELSIDGQRIDSDDTHTRLTDWLNKHSEYNPELPSYLPFVGGVIGYFGYRWRHAFLGLEIDQRKPKPKRSLPIAELFATDWSLVIDHKQQTTALLFSSQQSTKKHYPLLQNRLQNKGLEFEPFYCEQFSPETTKTEYLAALNHIHEYILAGDCYQTNFSQRFKANYSGDLSAAYSRLRQATPSPYSAFIAGSKTHILSASPERFLTIKDREVVTQPIKGTCPRGRTPEQDKALSEALLNSEKNRAENVMIVDLLRNDLSQCCEPFSVKVPKLCELHTFANVHHLISTVTGKLSKGVSAFELFTRSFPGGSITGAPKKRSMEIIDELEPHERGVYCGSIGYFSKNNRHDSNIAIRTLQAYKEELFCWGGGGIVADSNNEEEYQESIIKVKKLMDALV